MTKDTMLVEFLKKESATVALISLLNAFNITGNKKYKRRRPSNPGIWAGQITEATSFCKRWVKNNRD